MKFCQKKRKKNTKSAVPPKRKKPSPPVEFEFRDQNLNSWVAVAFTDRWYPGKVVNIKSPKLAEVEFLVPVKHNDLLHALFRPPKVQRDGSVLREEVHAAGVLCSGFRVFDKHVGERMFKEVENTKLIAKKYAV